jgi:hypothetical protein
LKSPSIFVCARQLCRSTDLPTTMLCPSSSHQSRLQSRRSKPRRQPASALESCCERTSRFSICGSLVKVRSEFGTKLTAESAECCPESGPSTGAGPSEAGASENVIAITVAAVKTTHRPTMELRAMSSLGRLRGRLDLAVVGHVDRGSRGDVAGRPAEDRDPRLAHAALLHGGAWGRHSSFGFVITRGE